MLSKSEISIICDPVHGMMKFDSSTYAIIKRVIDHPLFQRLRHIKQLSFAEFIYPGAVHTRFNHSIGAAYLASKVSDNICADDKAIITLSALLHDIGHAPFSHAFEDIYDGNYKINHEDWGSKFIDDLIKDKDLKDIKDELSLASDILNNKINKYHNIISSQLDVDRFDYLLRDSHFCGVSYGRFDADWLISCLKIHDNKIAILPKGLKTLEHYLMARRTMNHNVYLHKKSCAGSYIFKSFSKIIKNNLSSLSEYDGFSFINYINKINQSQDKYQDCEKFKKEVLNKLFSTYTKLNENEVWYLMRVIIDSGISVNKNNIVPNALYDASNSLLNRDLPKIYQLRTGIFNSVVEKIKTEIKNCSHDIQAIFDLYLGIDMPKFYAYKSNGDDSKIYMVEYNESDESFPICDVTSYSETIRSYMNRGEEISYLYSLDTINTPKECKRLKTKIIKELFDNGCFMPWEKID